MQHLHVCSAHVFPLFFSPQCVLATYAAIASIFLIYKLKPKKAVTAKWCKYDDTSLSCLVSTSITNCWYVPLLLFADVYFDHRFKLLGGEKAAGRACNKSMTVWIAYVNKEHLCPKHRKHFIYLHQYKRLLYRNVSHMLSKAVFMAVIFKMVLKHQWHFSQARGDICNKSAWLRVTSWLNYNLHSQLDNQR